MIELPLYPVPREGWQAEFDACMEDEYIRRKYNREKSIREHDEYFRRHCPDLRRFCGRVNAIVDVGPGFGVGLEWWRAYGYIVLGVDAPSGIAGMGSDYYRLSCLMHERQRLPVLRVGWEEFVSNLLPSIERCVRLFNFRGSIEQCFADLLLGRPHHEHHDAKQQVWDRTKVLHTYFIKSFQFMADRLLPDSFILIHANGTGAEESNAWYDEHIRKAASDAGLTLDFQEGLLLHRWRSATK